MSEFVPKYSQEEILRMVDAGKISILDAAGYQFIPEGESDSWIEGQRKSFRKRWATTRRMISSSKFQGII